MSYPYQILTEQEYQDKYQQSILAPEKFWAEVASHFSWHRKWDEVLNYNFETAHTHWFVNGKLNITENCIDKHLKNKGDNIAIIWESNFENEESQFITYKQLHERVIKFTEVLKNNGIKKGDRICINMGMIPELAIAVLACARIGAIHSVIFGGFSASSIADRLEDTEAKMIICCDGAYRGDKIIPIKKIIDDSILIYNKVETVIIYKRSKTEIDFNPDRDKWWHEEEAKITLINDQPEIMDSEDPLFILYTSGSTGKPKGAVHTIGGYMIYTAYTFVNVFQYSPGMIHFCTADIGWITGHSYIVYGPLLAGATSLMYEGIPTWPDAGRFWKIIDKHKVNIFYTAPTAIRSLMSFGHSQFDNAILSSLKTLGTVGEPINEEAWKWYFDHVGKGKCPIVDTWWQTETGGILISSLSGVTDASPTFAGKPLPGIQPVILDEQGKEILTFNKQGNLCIKFPWPSIIRTTYKNHDRCRSTYFSIYSNKYFTGDGAYRDESGNFRIIGRVDDVLNVSGHRIGTAELENVLNSHSLVIESAVVGYPHEIKGEGIYAYVICDPEQEMNNSLHQELIEIVKHQIGSFARPDKILIVPGLPKTRSGKIMRRILRKIASGEHEQLGDLTSLLDSSVVEKIILLARS
ncbi:MAG: acetate--CoA ligase [Saprospiraceae bacterium]|nr:acetate--CoA ligase [Saprospiraceae bacterium]